MGKKISELQESEQINNSDYLVAVINGQTIKVITPIYEIYESEGI